MQLKKINFEKLYGKINAGLELLIKIDEHEAKLRENTFEKLNRKNFLGSLPFQKEIVLLHFKENCEPWYYKTNENAMKEAFDTYMMDWIDVIDIKTITNVELKKRAEKRAISYIRKVMNHHDTLKELNDLDWLY